MKILFLSHGHPTLSAGGAERAAYSLYRHAAQSNRVSQAVFAATVQRDLIGHDADYALFRGNYNEILFNLPKVDHFTHQSMDYDNLKKTLVRLIDYAKPDIVNLHHFVTSGVEVVNIFKELGVSVVLTLHEYLLICHNFGQMVKTTGKLCHVGSNLECSKCFPEYSPGRFFLREQMIKTYLSECDFLVSPSNFLRQRFVDWGVSPDAIVSIENPLDPHMIDNARHAIQQNDHSTSLGKYKIAYFGQINPFKGLDILLKAISLLPEEVRSSLHIGIHGANLDIWHGEFKEKIEKNLTSLSDCVHNYGPYDNEMVVDLMRSYDRIVVPSIWWENSPVVIQEARIAGTPLLCSKLGGMAEKASDVNDVLFQGGNPISLSNEIAKLVTSTNRPRNSMPNVERTQADFVNSYIDLYESVLSLK